MQHSRKTSHIGGAALMLAVILGASFSSGTIAQTTSSPTTTATASTLSPSVIKALQDALNKQGVTVETTGVFDDATRNALRRFQSQHHLTVTGEADGATLSKLGIPDQAISSPSTIGQAPPSTAGSASPLQAPAQGPSGMMSGPMMQGMMQGMMQTMHGMMGMMEGQQPGQTRPGPMQSAPMQSPSEATTSGCPMMSGGQMSMPAMRQMMQGMMQMMRAMQNQMQSDQKSQGAQ
jgi:peptidoglycan hydrolase-like protein with peptidoglycan-binding domain